MRRQREEDDQENTSTKPSQSQQPLPPAKASQPTSTSNNSTRTSSNNTPRSLNSRTMTIFNKVVAALLPPTKKFQKPLFFEQRVLSAEKEVIKHSVNVHLGSNVIADRDSVFIAFAAVGVQSIADLRAFNNYVNTLVSYISSTKKPAHGFMVTLQCNKSSWKGLEEGNHEKDNNNNNNNNKEVKEKTVTVGGSSKSVMVYSDDDKETHADEHMEKLLSGFLFSGSNAKSSVFLEKGVAVSVTRWFGGTLLGPDRFTHIKNCCSTALNEVAHYI